MKEFSNGKISKGDLKVIIDKSEKEESELTQIKLRKVKVEKIRSEIDNPVDNGEPKSMKDLLSMFGNSDAKKVAKPEFE